MKHLTALLLCVTACAADPTGHAPTADPLPDGSATESSSFTTPTTDAANDSPHDNLWSRSTDAPIAREATPDSFAPPSNVDASDGGTETASSESDGSGGTDAMASDDSSPTGDGSTVDGSGEGGPPPCGNAQQPCCVNRPANPCNAAYSCFNGTCY